MLQRLRSRDICPRVISLFVVKSVKYLSVCKRSSILPHHTLKSSRYGPLLWWENIIHITVKPHRVLDVVLQRRAIRVQVSHPHPLNILFIPPSLRSAYDVEHMMWDALQIYHLHSSLSKLNIVDKHINTQKRELQRDRFVPRRAGVRESFRMDLSAFFNARCDSAKQQQRHRKRRCVS